MPTVDPSRPARLARVLFWLTILAAAAVFLLGLLVQFSGYQVLDDSYMPSRYAGNLLEHGTVAWNPRGEPVYGLTSLFFLVVVTLVRLATGADPSLVAYLSSLSGGFIFVTLLILLLRRHGTRWSLLLVVFALGTATSDIAFHFSSGMDTTFAMAWVTAYILLCKEHELRAATWSAVAVGLWGGLSYFARPDLLLYAYVVPGAVLLFGPSRAARRQALLALGITTVVVAVEMAAAAWYFGSALPMSFYVKSTRIYGASVYEAYRTIPTRRLLAFAASCWPLLLALAASALAAPKDFVKRMPPTERGLLIASALFLAYYVAFVLQIESSGQRFYYPTFPALALVAAGSLARLTARMAERTRRRLQRSSSVLCAAGFLLVLLSLVPPMLWMRTLWASEPVRANFARFDLLRAYEPYRGLWHQLDKVAALPDDLTIALTDVGIPSVMNPGKTIVDMAGLHEPTLARRGFSADYILRRYRPDLIYMPLPHYRRMTRQLTSSPLFRQHYELISAAELRTTVGVALRRDSPHYPKLRAIIAAGPPPRPTPPAGN